MLVDNSYQTVCEIEYTTHLPKGKGMQQKNRGPSEENLRNLRECRKFLRFKHAEMAAALGIPQSTYASYESGARKAPPEILEKARIIAIQDGRPYPAHPSDAESVSVQEPQMPAPEISPESIEEASLFVDEILASRRLIATDLRKKAKLVRLIAEELSEEARKGTQGNLKELIRERFGKVVEIALG